MVNFAVPTQDAIPDSILELYLMGFKNTMVAVGLVLPGLYRTVYAHYSAHPNLAHRWYFRTARLCSFRVLEKWWVPSFLETK
jgi:hypothetical protein